jgi:hypothetical protein
MALYPTSEEHERTIVEIDSDDERAIRRGLEEYCLRLEVDTMQSWGELFHPDATLGVYGREVVGRDRIIDLISQAPPGVHVGGCTRITPIDAVSAAVIQSYLFLPADGSAMRGGWYHDRWVSTARQWLIARREITFTTPEGPSPRPARAK